MRATDMPPNKRMHLASGAPHTGCYLPPAGDAQR